MEIAYSDAPATTTTDPNSLPNRNTSLTPDQTSTPGDSNPWVPLAPSTSFPNLPPNQRITAPPPDPWDEPSSAPIEEPNCKVFKIEPPNENGGIETLTEISLSEAQLYCSWQPQLLVFRSKGRVWAVQHACPHRGAALSRGRLVDLEDAVGVVCAVHGWAFELETGMGSKSVDVGVWETREVEGRVWVRRGW